MGRDVADGHGQPTRPDCIVLIGFMAAGKSVVGRLLADRLGWELVDLDQAIEDRVGRPPGAIIRDDGEAAFRALEAEATTELGQRSGIVVAPGGGWALQPKLATLLGPGAVRVWLRVSPETAVRRAEADGADRPLLGAPEGRLERVTALLERRRPNYERAEIAVDTDEKTPEAVADEILSRLGLDTGDA